MDQVHALEKPMPSHTEAEKTLLGSVLLDNEQIGAIAESLAPQDFYHPMYLKIYEAMLDLYAKSLPIDPISIQNSAKARYQEIPISRISELMHGLPNIKDLAHHIGIVSEKSRARALIRACNAGLLSASSETESVDEVADRIEQSLFEIRAEQAGSIQHISEIAFASVSDASQRAKENKSMVGLGTNFRRIDTLTGGLQQTDLIILAARPSMGKSALSLDLCYGVTQHTKQAVIAYFSLEMSKKQCADRFICANAEIDSSRFRLGMLSTPEWEEVFRVTEDLNSRRIHIDDTPALSVFDIKSKARRVHSKEGRLDLIVIDYLQLMRGGKKSDSRQQEVSDISRDLKALAKEMKVPILALSQLSRSCEARQDKRPLLSDLRESGAIEQDADIVAFLYRDEYYNEPTVDTAGKAELIFRKHRHGATDTITLNFIKRFAKFTDNYGN